jgi:hypothetical protein
MSDKENPTLQAVASLQYKAATKEHNGNYEVEILRATVKALEKVT